MRHRLAALLLALAIASPVFAAPRPVVEITAPGYRVISAVGEKAALGYLAELERFKLALETILHVRRASSPIETRIWIASSKDWETTLRPGERVAGFWFPGRFQNFVVVDGGVPARDVLTSILHEYAHDFVHTQLGRDFPAWWNEGFADFMSAARFETNRVLFPIPDHHYWTLRSGAWIPLERVLTADHGSPHRLAPAFYAQAWLLVYYGRAENRAFGKRLERHLVAYDQGASIRESVETTFGAELGALDEQLSAFARRARFRTARLTLGDAAALGAAPPRRLGAAEATREIAELAIETGQPMRAVPVLDALLSERADVPTLALRALAAARANAADAEAWFVRASDAAPQPDFVVAKRLAVALLTRAETQRDLDSPPNDERKRLARASRALFERALALSGEDLESTYGFALASYYAEDGYELAHERVVAARARAPASGDLAYVAALLSERLGQLESAREAWRAVVRTARFPQLRAMARDRVLALAMEG